MNVARGALSSSAILLERQIQPPGDGSELLVMRQSSDRPQPALRNLVAGADRQALDGFEDGGVEPRSSKMLPTSRFDVVPTSACGKTADSLPEQLSAPPVANGYIEVVAMNDRGEVLGRFVPVFEPFSSSSFWHGLDQRSQASRFYLRHGRRNQ
jgi:hypothetical protein